jgi:hypothetical protein
MVAEKGSQAGVDRGDNQVWLRKSTPTDMVGEAFAERLSRGALCRTARLPPQVTSDIPSCSFETAMRLAE